MIGGQAGSAGRNGRSREPLTRPERLMVGMAAGMVTLVGALIGAGVLAFVSLSGQLLDMQMDIQKQIGALTERLAVVEQRLTVIEERLTVVEERLTRLEERMTVVENRLTVVETRLTALEVRMTAAENLIQTHLVPRSDTSAPSDAAAEPGAGETCDPVADGADTAGGSEAEGAPEPPCVPRGVGAMELSGP